MSPSLVPPEPSAVERVLKAIGLAFASLRDEARTDQDLFDGLSEAEEQVLQKHWPQSHPSGDGVPLYDEVVEIRVRRLRWRSHLKTAREIAWLILVTVACLALIWHQFLR